MATGDKVVRVRDDVHRQLAETAAAEGITLGEAVERAITIYREERRRGVIAVRTTKMKVTEVPRS